jgi:hypothetical protein
MTSLISLPTVVLTRTQSILDVEGSDLIPMCP